MDEIRETEEVDRWVTTQALNIMAQLGDSPEFHCQSGAQLLAMGEIVALALAAYNLGKSEGRTEARS